MTIQRVQHNGVIIISDVSVIYRRINGVAMIGQLERKLSLLTIQVGYLRAMHVIYGFMGDYRRFKLVAELGSMVSIEGKETAIKLRQSILMSN